MARIVLLVAAIVEFVFRGLPAYFGAEWVSRLLGLEYIEGALVYIHPFGGLLIAFGVMFYLAFRDPEKQRFVMGMGILRYALGIGSYVVTLVMLGSIATFWWIHLVIDVILLVLFIIAKPKKAPAAMG